MSLNCPHCGVLLPPTGVICPACHNDVQWFRNQNSLLWQTAQAYRRGGMAGVGRFWGMGCLIIIVLFFVGPPVMWFALKVIFTILAILTWIFTGAWHSPPF